MTDVLAVSIVNRALVIAGVRRKISTFTEDSAEAIVADAVYDDVVEEALSERDWSFATSWKALNRTAEDPPAEWSTAWEFPKGAINIQTVMIADHPIRYATVDKKIFCDAGPTEEVICRYTYRPSEYYWSASFRRMVIYRLAVDFAASITRKAELVAALDKREELTTAKARNIDAQQDTARRIKTGGKIVGSRRGARVMR